MAEQRPIAFGNVGPGQPFEGPDGTVSTYFLCRSPLSERDYVVVCTEMTPGDPESEFVTVWPRRYDLAEDLEQPEAPWWTRLRSVMGTIRAAWPWRRVGFR